MKKAEKEKWFSEVFLSSFDKKFKQNLGTKYEGRIIISDKQADVCYRNMDTEDCHGDYGNFTRWLYIIDNSKINDEHSTHVMKTIYEVQHLGKYYFLWKYEEDYIHYHTLPDDFDDDDDEH